MANAVDVLAPVPAHVRPDCVVDVDIYNLPGATQDVHRAWVEFQKSARTDLVWTPRNGGHWIVTRGEEVHRMIADWEHFSNRVNTIPPEIGASADFIPIQLDPPRHTPYRTAVKRTFNAKLLRPLEEQVHALARSVVKDARALGSFDFVAEIAEILPVTVFLTLVGVPVDDRFYLRSLVEQLNRPDGGMSGDEVMARITEYLEPVVQQRLANPGDDLISKILATPIEGRPWTQEEAMRLCRNLFVGGLDTVVAMLGWIALYLARNPERQAELRAHPELCPQAADEFIRRFAPVQLVREVVVDHTVGGIELKAGDVVLLTTMLHNLDERSFDDPLKVDFTRRPVEHSTMGNGPHRCVGAGLARMELASFLEEWTSETGEFQLAPGEELVMRSGGTAAVRKLPLVWKAAETVL